jgi:hypothetical protein
LEGRTNAYQFIARLQEQVYILLRVQPADKEDGVPLARKGICREWIASGAILEFAEI